MDTALQLVALTLAAGTPLVFAALGELVTEKSGVLNLGVEGMMLVGAVTAFAVAATTKSPWLGVLAGMAAGAAVSMLFALITLTLMANQVATGLALSLFGVGLSAFVGLDYVAIVIEGIKPLAIPGLSDLPVLGKLLLISHNPLVYVSLALFALVHGDSAAIAFLADLGYPGLALAYAVLPDYSTRISYENAFRLLTDAVGMALGLDPTLPEPYAALAAPASWERRRTTAITMYRRAIAIRPSFATAYQWLGTDTMMAGDPQAGLEALDRASELDPRSLVVANNRAYVLLTLDRVADARATCERVLAFASDYRGCQIRVAFAELLRGDPEAVRPYLHAIARTGDGSALQLVDEIVDAQGSWRSTGGGAAPRGVFRPQRP